MIESWVVLSRGVIYSFYRCTSPKTNRPEGAVLQKNKEEWDSEIKWGSEGWCHSQAKAQILILACFLLLMSTSLCSRDICSLQSQIGDKAIQCTVLSIKPSGLWSLCLALWLMMPFLSNSLKALVKGPVTNGFLSVTSVLQCHVLLIAPSPSPGGDEKVILIFQRNTVIYSISLYIAYSLHISLFYFLKLIFGDYWWS